MKAKRYLGLFGAIVISFLALLGAGVAFAGFTATTGQVTELSTPPANVTSTGGLESDTTAFVFVERENVKLKGPILVDGPGSTTSIKGGTVVTSHLIYFNRAGVACCVTVSGSATFDSEILGVIVETAKLDASDLELGITGTLYADPTRGTGDLGDSWSVTGQTLTFTLETSVGVDHIRVVTAGGDGESKSSILSEAGVPGQGIETAPGLQTSFNPQSQAAESVGN